jgi:hypothetical protein
MSPRGVDSAGPHERTATYAMSIMVSNAQATESGARESARTRRLRIEPDQSDETRAEPRDDDAQAQTECENGSAVRFSTHDA